jgi:uncharacterized membrane protein
MNRERPPLVSSVRATVRRSFVTGLAVLVPVVVTVVVVAFVFGHVYRVLDLSADLLQWLPGVSVERPSSAAPGLLVEGVVLVVTLVAITLLGLAVNVSRYGERAVDYLDYVVTQVPGVGSVYRSFRQMSEVMLDSDAENFREVKLVEFPGEGVYALGFVTAATPPAVTDAAGHDRMYTMFLPMAPNPVMGGHLVHVPDARVYDVDMSVEEGVQAVVTSGVAVGATGGRDGLDPEALAGLGADARAGQRFDPAADPSVSRPGPAPTDRADRYDEHVDPVNAETPASIARRERSTGADANGEGGTDADANADADAGTDGSPSRRPAAMADREASARDSGAAPSGTTRHRNRSGDDGGADGGTDG